MADGTITGSAGYAALEEALADDLAVLRPRWGAGIWVLVPTNLLALHLQRSVAERLEGIAGVQFLTLKDAARRVALPQVASRGGRYLPEGAAELALQRCLDAAPRDSYFAGFRPFRNAACAMLRAVVALQNSLWTPADLREAAGRAPFRDGTAPRRLEELAGLWEELQAWKAENGLLDADDLILQAGGADGEAAEQPEVLLLYGFYDFTPAQRRMVGRLASRAGKCSAYLLWREENGEPAPGFGYAEPTVAWLRETVGLSRTRLLDSPADAADSDLAGLVGGVFREWPVEGEEALSRRLREKEIDESVRILSCPGEEAEAVEAVREVLGAALDADGSPEIGILLRDAQTSTGLLEEAFDRAGVEWFVREGLPLAATAAGRVALGLLDVAAGEARRADIVDFCALARVDWPEGLSSVALDRLSRESGIVKGSESWRKLLSARAARLSEEARHADDEEEQQALVRDARLCELGAGFVDEFLQQVDFAAESRWSGVADRLACLFERFCPELAPAREQVMNAIEELGALDVTGTAPEPDRLRWVLGRRLERASRGRGGFQRTGVTVSSIMTARGTTFDLVIVPGLVEKSFPRRTAEQPVLTEADREALNRVAAELGCGELPLQRRRPAEERYLLRVALGSARRAVVLAYPRLDRDKGRPRMPSRFLGDVCSALVGTAVPAGILEEGLDARWFRRVPLNRRDAPGQEARPAIDAREYDAAVYVGGPEYRTGYMAAVSEWFGRALRMEEERWRARDFGAYDGKIRTPDLLEFLRGGSGPLARPVSPTSLERYAACPFDYFLRHVLGVEEIEEPSEEFLLSPRDRGSLVHELLSLLYRECLRGVRLGDLSRERIDAVAERAEELLDELGGPHAGGRPAAWQAEREEILQQVQALLAHERADHAGAAPERFELEFELSPAILDGDMTFRGRIDRVDLRSDGGVQVVDYKTGASRGRKRNRFVGGTQLQLPIYLLCASDLLKARSGAALYLYVSHTEDVPEFTLTELHGRMDDLRAAIGLIRDGVGAGYFFPFPAGDRRARDLCARYCPYRHVCGSARDRLAEIKQTDPDARRLKELRAID